MGFPAPVEQIAEPQGRKERRRGLPGPPPPAWLSSRCWNSAPATPCARSRTPSPAWDLRDGQRGQLWGLGDPQLASTAQPGVENVVLGILWLGQLTGFAIVPFGPQTGPFPPFSHKQKVKYPKEKTQLVNPAEREERGRLTLGGYEVVGPVVTLQGKQRRQAQGGLWGTRALPHQTLLPPPAGPQAARATGPVLPQHPVLAQISSPPSQQRLL